MLLVSPEAPKSRPRTMQDRQAKGGSPSPPFRHPAEARDAQQPPGPETKRPSTSKCGASSGPSAARPPELTSHNLNDISRSYFCFW